MKKPLLFFLLVSLSLLSCKKNEDDKLDPDGDRFSAMIDGTLFEASKVTATRQAPAGTSFFPLTCAFPAGPKTSRRTKVCPLKNASAAIGF